MSAERLAVLEAKCATLRTALEHAREEIHAAYGEYDASIDEALAGAGAGPSLGQLRACQALLFRWYDEGWFDVHDHGCPEDDTCCCVEAAELNACLKEMP